MSIFQIPHVIFERNFFTFSALKCCSVSSQYRTTTLFPFFPLLWILTFSIFVYKTLLEKDNFKESSISTESLPTACRQWSEPHVTTSARTSTHASTTAAGRQCQMSASSLYLMEFVPLILVMKSKYRYLFPGPDRHLELWSATMPSKSSKCWKPSL